MTQDDIKAIIQRYVEAEEAVLQGKTVTFNGQTLAMESLGEIRSGRQEWERKLSDLVNQKSGRGPWKLARFG
ncbi:hypothetical protein QQF21_17195 [Lelliottia sp. V89_10]|uniref:hypothetical protein n=1 Tax=Lelliottia wanjuensis TaxID=3050585 RepID=UPI00249DEBEE|nr:MULTISPECIES: hypothetical protein [unclassified Lelliottia]MDI3359769.1 hypothetical protein [Lelliottia sp. V89_13]MDK9548727.1 hypothetical protein [Lelliottia sp. V89_5]MDK9597359.1 hypothetical protein [Lelliottia sp. V89_10]